MQTDNKTYLARKEDIKPKWYLVDASNKVLGRLATRLATILLGKHQPIYTPYVDTGDFVIVVNAEKIKLTGKKMIGKTYKKYTGYSDGLKYIPIKTILEKTPEKAIFLAVKRMLPHNRLAKQIINKLKVYAGPQHPHQAQNPKIMEIKL
jgi:large subunit ribosomal protein L13